MFFPKSPGKIVTNLITCILDFVGVEEIFASDEGNKIRISRLET